MDPSDHFQTFKNLILLDLYKPITNLGIEFSDWSGFIYDFFNLYYIGSKKSVIESFSSTAGLNSGCWIDKL